MCAIEFHCHFPLANQVMSLSPKLAMDKCFDKQAMVSLQLQCYHVNYDLKDSEI